MDDTLKAMFEPNLLPFIEDLVENAKLGLCGGRINIHQVRDPVRRTFSKDSTPHGSRFHVIIPYAGKSMMWDVVFFGNSVEYPPDFLFDDCSFLPNLEEIPSLVAWQGKNVNELRNVIAEILALYRQYQSTLTQEYTRINFEYTQLICQTDFTEEDVEVQMPKKDKNRNGGGGVNFLIKLPVDFAKIPLLPVKEENSTEDSAVLLITYVSPDTGRAIPQLFLAPRVEQSLGGSANLRIPPFPNEGCLMDYVPIVCQLLKNKVDQIADAFEKKQLFITELIKQCGKAVLEWDATNFHKITFLFDYQEFHFIVQLRLPKFFPVEKPEILFQSIYHYHNDRPVFSAVNDYPYSPRWSAQELTERLRGFIVEHAPKFRTYSVARNTR